MFTRGLALAAACLLPTAAQSQGLSQSAMARAAMSQSIAIQKLSAERQRAAIQQISPTRVLAQEIVTRDFAGGDPFNCERVDGEFLAPDIESATSDNKLPQNLVEAVIETESAFHPCAVSSKGALGLMQLMPETASSLGVVDPFDAKSNLLAGSRYLGGLLTKYSGDVRLALAAYNAGSGAVDRYNGVPPFNETQDYVQKVMALWQSSRRPARVVGSGPAIPMIDPVVKPAFSTADLPGSQPPTTVSCFGPDSQRSSCPQ